MQIADLGDENLTIYKECMYLNLNFTFFPKPAEVTKIPNLFFVLVIEYWNLRFVCNLVLGIWDFINFYTPK